ncbi:hypothetical protein [Pandoraea terrigena]|uniref:Uncharacterized protein n=1 Tax=Pandoraea terrigena TaxID=2508292 RepID=A0A5E4UXQ6_9BURK|nr:hypothetical protein [Pandoraea terrigena]VVE04686.1 hypothetical protein PTE31013_02325 [Pandoraea terrigena]
MKDIEREIDKLWKRINRMQAQVDAMATVVHAALPLLQDSSTFAAVLRDTLDARMSNRLCGGVDEDFVAEYVSCLRTILPKQLSATLTQAGQMHSQI